MWTLEAAVVDADRLVEARLPGRHVVEGQEPGVLAAAGVGDGILDEGDDGLGDLAAVEQVGRGLDAGHPALGAPLLVGAAHLLENLRPVRVAQQLTGCRRGPTGQVDPARGRVLVAVLGGVVAQRRGQLRVHGEAVLRQVDGRLEDLREPEPAEAGHRERPGADHRGHAGRQVPVPGHQVDAVLPAPVDGERLRRPAHAAELEHPLLLSRIDQRRHLAADAVALRLQQIEAEAHRRGRVDGVPPLLHDAETRCRGEVVTGGDHTPLPHHYRTCGESCHLRLLCSFFVRLTG